MDTVAAGSPGRARLPIPAPPTATAISPPGDQFTPLALRPARRHIAGLAPRRLPRPDRAAGARHRADRHRGHSGRRVAPPGNQRPWPGTSGPEPA